MFGTKKSRGWTKTSTVKRIGVGMLVAGAATAAVYGVRAYLRWRAGRNQEEDVNIIE